MDRLLFTVSRVLSWCPDWLLIFVAECLTIIFYDIFRLRRRMILGNLNLAFGQEYDEKTRQMIARKSYLNFILTSLEFLLGPHRDIAGHIEIRGREHIDQALAKGQGAYILGSHLGNWEALGAAVSRRVRTTHITVKKVGSDRVNHFVEEVRRMNGFHWISRKSTGDALRAIRTALRSQELVGFVYDQARPGEPRLPFFGHPAKTNTSLAAIWRRYPAPIVPAYIYRVKLGHHVVTFDQEVQLPLTEDRDQDILNHSIRLNEEVERMIRLKPEHYFWFHNRWK